MPVLVSVPNIEYLRTPQEKKFCNSSVHCGRLWPTRVSAGAKMLDYLNKTTFHAVAVGLKSQDYEKWNAVPLTVIQWSVPITKNNK